MMYKGVPVRSTEWMRSIDGDGVYIVDADEMLGVIPTGRRLTRIVVIEGGGPLSDTIIGIAPDCEPGQPPRCRKLHIYDILSKEG